MTRFHVPPPVICLAAGLLQLLLPGRESEGSPRARRRALGSALGLSSAALGLSAVVGFARHRTTVDPVHPERASVLVTTGVQAFTRNPMYLALAGALGAHALWRGGSLAWLPVGGFVAAVNRLQIAGEERALAAAFGSEYARYLARVPRWIGPVRRG